MTTWLIAGLGNPGREHAQNRHNVGFMAVDALAEKYGSGAWKNVFQSQVHSATIDGQNVLLQKPQTYMNLSGEAVGACARFYKIPVENIIAIHDELDIPAMTVRIKQGGGNGGHNGLKSIDQHVGNNYWRIRLGIGHPGDKEMVTGHVLNDFSKDEWPDVEKMLQGLAKEFGLMFEGGANKLAAAISKKEEKVKEEKDGI
jgi:PTH1 family peptidyl-tRNA hydrolase